MTEAPENIRGALGAGRAAEPRAPGGMRKAEA